jgi:hypothetical protein
MKPGASCERKSRRIWAPRLAALLAGACVWMLAPAIAQAALPTVTGFGAQATSPETEVVSGQINPGGESTEYLVAYETAKSDWCKSHPATHPSIEVQLLGGELALSLPFDGGNGHDGWKPPHTTEPQTLPFADGEPHAVSVELEGLAHGTEYCAQLIAFNDSGRAAGTKGFFVSGAPSVIDAQFLPVSNSLEAEVNPAGQATSYQVLYAPIESEWCETSGAKGVPATLGALTPLGFEDGSYHAVAVNLMGLQPGEEYCAAMYAENDSGSGQSLQVSLAVGPAVESVTPAAGPVGGGSSVTIKGQNLGGASAVHFGKAAASIQSDAPETIVVTTPAHEAAGVDVTVTTPAGTSATSEADRFTYESSAGTQTGGGGGGGGGGSGGPGPSNNPGTAGNPTLGETEVTEVTEGTVTVKTPGSKSFTPFSGGKIPDGSEIDATHGKVIITVVEPDGKTVSAEVFGGRFRLHQDKNGETHFILTLPLNGCPRTKLPRGSAAAVIARRRHRPKSRYLWVTEKGGHWGTNGRYVSTSVEGTSWLTFDECTRSVVKVAKGRVKVYDLVTRRIKTLGPGGRFVAYAKRRHH